RVVGLDQEPIGQRSTVVGRRQVLRDVTVLGYSFWREDRTHLFQKRKRTLAGRMVGEIAHEFVLCRGLPCETKRGVLGEVVVVGRPAQVRLVEHGPLALVVVVASLIERSVLVPRRAEEPQLVLPDRAAHTSADVVVPPD